MQTMRLTTFINCQKKSLHRRGLLKAKFTQWKVEIRVQGQVGGKPGRKDEGAMCSISQAKDNNTNSRQPEVKHEGKVICVISGRELGEKPI